MHYVVRGPAVDRFEAWFNSHDGTVVEAADHVGWMTRNSLLTVMYWCRQHRVRVFVSEREGCPRAQIHFSSKEKTHA